MLCRPRAPVRRPRAPVRRPRAPARRPQAPARRPRAPARRPQAADGKTPAQVRLTGAGTATISRGASPAAPIFTHGGPVAEWLCRGLQSPVRRFDSGPGLHFKTLSLQCGIGNPYGALLAVPPLAV